MISASWDRSGPPSEQYLMLRDFFLAASSAATLSTGGSFYTIRGTYTSDEHVITEYVGRDGSRVRASSSGERTEDGSLKFQTFSYKCAPNPGDEP